jgi:hypothetical protein
LEFFGFLNHHDSLRFFGFLIHHDSFI